MMELDFAIIIGINHYTPPNSRGLRQLKGAVNDADRLESWLVSATGGNVPPGNIKKITSSPVPLQPLQDAIDDAFLEIESAIKAGGGKARRLYFYFAGHGLGTLDNTANTALCLANWSENRRHSALSSEEYKDAIKQYGLFNEIIFVADCCRNTKINIKPKAPTFAVPVPVEAAGQTKMFVAYATQYQDQSYEVESVNESGTSEFRGAFTKVFIDGLLGGAANNGTIGADDLRDFLIKKTPEIAKGLGYKQVPDIFHNFANNASLVNVPEVKSVVNFIFDPARNNPIELIDGDLNIIQSFNVTQEKNYSIPLSKGLYLLRDTKADENKPFQVSSNQKVLDVKF